MLDGHLTPDTNAARAGGAACCAHRTVKYDTKKWVDGTVSDLWECHHCGERFVQAMIVREILGLAEILLEEGPHDSKILADELHRLRVLAGMGPQPEGAVEQPATYECACFEMPCSCGYAARAAREEGSDGN